MQLNLQLNLHIWYDENNIRNGIVIIFVILHNKNNIIRHLMEECSLSCEDERIVPNNC